MDERIKGTVDKVVQLTKQNPEFDQELRKALGIKSQGAIAINDDRLDEIYEYCIKQILLQQAESFYQRFKEIDAALYDQLVSDYVRMEKFRRQDAFGDYALAAYQQVECLSNYIAEDSDFYSFYKHFLDSEIYNGKKVEKHVWWSGDDEIKNGWTRLKEGKLFAKDKMSINMCIYFKFKNNPKFPSADYRAINTILNDMYACRNANHRNLNNQPNSKAAERENNASQSYFIFSNALLEYTKQCYLLITEKKKIINKLMLEPKEYF